MMDNLNRTAAATVSEGTDMTPSDSKKQAARADALAQARADRLKLLGHIIRVSRGDLSQSELAERVSEVRGTEVIQTSISRWEAGMVDMSVEMLRDIEDALQLDRGALLVSAGYVSTGFHDVAALMRSDPHLHPDLRADAERAYKMAVTTSRRLMEAEDAARRKPAARRSANHRNDR